MYRHVEDWMCSGYTIILCGFPPFSIHTFLIQFKHTLFICILKIKLIGTDSIRGRYWLTVWLKNLDHAVKICMLKKMRTPEQIHMVHTNHALTSKCLHTNLASPRRQTGWDPEPSIYRNVGMKTSQMRNSTGHHN